MLRKLNYFKSVYDNSLDAWVPEHWGNESIAILLESMVAANLVHTDFRDEIAEFGDIVNTRKPGTFVGKRKGNTDSVTVQDASATNIQIPLNQHFHVSFMIKDGEESKSFKSLVDEYLRPAVVAIAQSIDKVLLGQHVHFMGNSAGGIGELSSSNARETILDLRKVMNIKKVYPAGRNLILGPTNETTVLKDEAFTDADKVGDNGTALREASLGRRLGFNIFMCQNMSEFTNADTGTATAVDGGEPAGETTIVIDDAADTDPGDMVTIAGDMTPQRVITQNDDSDTAENSIVISPGLRDSVLTAAVVTVYQSCLLDGAQAIGAFGYLPMDNISGTNYPQIGQQIIISQSDSTVDTSDYKYTIIDVIETSSGYAEVLLDRPLEELAVNNAIVSLFPTGNYGFAFHRNAIAFISRPLAQPRAGTGALSAVVNYNNVSIRVVITYDGKAQGHLVTVDLLCGVKVLDTDLGAVLLG